MAASLGSLVVSLGLNAAEFTAGINKAEFESQRAMRKIKADLDAVGTALGIAAVAAGAFALKIGSDFIDAAANLDDMAEKTGASVEELSKLSQQAHISGVSLETVETTLIQLSRHLNGAGEESKNTTRALDALGLSAAELKNLDTAEALQKVAVELNKFADGSGKSALAMDLLGRAGAQALPFLKDMANDAALTANVTAKQAAEAEELGKAWRRLTNEARVVGQAMALDIVPYLKDLIEQFKVGKEIAGGFWSALALFGTSNPFRTAGENIKSLSRTIEEFSRTRDELRGRGVDTKAIDQQIAGFEKQLKFQQLLQRQQALANAGGDTPGEMRRFGLSGSKAALVYESQADAKAKSVAKQMSLDELLAKAELKRLEQFEETEREATRIAEREAAERLRIAEKSLADTLRIHNADLEAQKYLQKEVEAFTVAPVYIDGLKDATEETTSVARELGLTFSSSLEEVVFGAQKGVKALDILKAAAEDVAKVLFRQGITEPLAKASSGLLGNLFAGIFGGSTAGMAARAPNDGNIEGRLLGSFATGTDYVPKTGPYLLHQGERVTRAGDNAVPSVNIVQNIHNDSRSDMGSIMQAMAAAKNAAVIAVRDEVRRAGEMRRLVRS